MQIYKNLALKAMFSQIYRFVICYGPKLHYVRFSLLPDDIRSDCSYGFGVVGVVGVAGTPR